MKLKKILQLFFLLNALEAIAAVIWLGSMPAEPGNVLALGYSLQRLILMGGMVLVAVLCLVPAWFIFKVPSAIFKVERFFKNRIFAISAWLMVVITWVACLTPAYQWGRFAGYKDRLLPVLIWVLLIGFQSCLLLMIQRKKEHPGSFWTELLAQPTQIKCWAITLGIMTVGILSIAIFRVGLVADIVYWNDANVPLLGIQILGVITASIFVMSGLSFFKLFGGKEKNCFQKNFPDIVISLLIWGMAVICWTQVSMPHSYFSPGPYPPNNEMYPFSDAARYDTAAEYALIGEGLGTNDYVDKPLYVAFLTLIHLLVGSRMESVVGLQVAFIALVPVLIYLIGRKIHNRMSGLMAAGFFVFREINNIQGTLWILSTNSRVLMSESLVTLLLILFVFMFTSWVRNPRNKLPLIAAGGALGLAGLVRLNPLLLMPVAFIAIWLVCWKQWKRGLINSLVFSLMFLATIFPWMLQSYYTHGNFLYFKSTMNGVVLDQRTYYSLNKPAVTQAPLKQNPPPQPAVQKPVNKTWFRITGVSQYVTAHFFHNMISATALFPTSLAFDSLEKMIKSPQSYWDPDWMGEVTAGQLTLIYLTMILISLGISAGWKQYRWAGLVPAGFLIAYSLATAAARTSGGRYILPADWVFLLYFALGVSQLMEWIQNWLHGDILRPVFETLKENEISSISPWVLGGAACLFIFLGCSPIMFDRAITRQYPIVDNLTQMQYLEDQGLMDSLGITDTKLKVFLQSPKAVIYKGRGLYPRYYAQDKGEPDRFSAMRAQPFPRIVLDVINQNGSISGVLPFIQEPAALPNGSEIIAIGCRGELNDDLLALIVGDTDKQIILRTPATEWTCPVTPPLCDNNRVCQ